MNSALVSNIVVRRGVFCSSCFLVFSATFFREKKNQGAAVIKIRLPLIPCLSCLTSFAYMLIMLMTSFAYMLIF